MTHCNLVRCTLVAVCLLCLPVHTLFSQQSNTQELSKKISQLFSQGKYSEALPVLAALERQLPNNAALMQNKALAYLNLGRYQESIAAANRTIALDKNNAAAYYIRGMTYMQLRQHEAALPDIERFIKAFPKDPGAYQNAATTLVFLGKYKQALENINKCIALNPQYASGYSTRIAIKQQLGETDIEADLLMVAKLMQNDYNALFDLRQYYLRSRKLAKAREMTQELIRLRPKEMLNVLMLGIIEFTMDNVQASINALSAVIQSDSTNAKAFAYRGLALTSAKKYRDAVQDCSTFFRLSPTDVTLTLTDNIMERKSGTANQGISMPPFKQMYAIRAAARHQLKDPDWYLDARKALLLGETPKYIAGLIDTSTINDEEILFNTSSSNIFRPRQWYFPEQKQFYPRDSTNLGRVPIEGSILRKGFDSLVVSVYKNTMLLQRLTQALSYDTSSTAPFRLEAQIQAEKAHYRIDIRLVRKTSATDTLLTRIDSLVCGDAYYISGQSNVVFGTEYQAANREYMRTFTISDNTTFWSLPPTRENTVGNVLAEELIKTSSVPIMLFNGGIGGVSIEQHLPSDRFLDKNTLYGQRFAFLQAAQVRQRLKGIIWYQGEANIGQGYTEKFDSLYRAWKQDFPSVQKIYIVQIRPSGCGQSTQDQLRDQQRQFTTRYPNVETLAASAPIPAHDGCHYGNAGYIALGKQLSALLARDLYRSADTIGISSPRLLKAAWTNAARNEIALTFASNDALVCGADTSIGGKIRTLAQDGFLLDAKPTPAVSVRSEKNMVWVKFPTSQRAKTMSYIPEQCYAASSDASCVVYEGPWITTTRGVGALTFANVTIDSP
ncbi:MAG: hypothetical protein EAZ92_17580 [Candidatus Kapaibacterium sp.]|nr:MAG: hypothetical protein EAZ92_17580 [Candidatus Kapabacteria bacterium]